jgi:hypothetical protein
MSHELTRELFSLLSWHMHHTDESPRDTLNRLVFKGFGLDISYRKIKVKEAEMGTSALISIRGDGHCNSQPKSVSVPIIIFAYGPIRRVLDGQNRINHWIDSGDPGPHRCLIVKIRNKPD